ncbi:MAG TPA: ATP-binding protein [Magnetospirillum sp.]|nr:ATP-binding protein [Magnetospirillum sp.]
MNRFRPSTSRALVIFGGIAIVAVIAMTAYEVWRQRATTLAAAEGNLSAISLALAQQTERAFHSVELVVDATALSVENAGGIARAGTSAVHEALRARLTGNPQISGLAILDAQGRVVNTAKRFPPPIENRADREFFAWHRASPSSDLHISTPLISPVDDNLVIPVSRRISGRDGSFQGVIVAAVDPEYFQQSYRRVLPPEGGASAIFRADGILLARTPPIDSMKLGQNFGRLTIFQPGAPAHGFGWGNSPMDGSLRMLSYHRLDQYPLIVNVSLRQDVLLQAWRDNALRLTLAAGAATIILGVAVFAFARQSRREEAFLSALRQSEERLRFAQFALDHAADMVFWVDAHGHILYANEAAARRLGYSREALVGNDIGIVDRHFSAEAWPYHLKRLKRLGHARFETTNTAADGRTYPAEVVANCVQFAGGDYVCAFVRDIGQRKAAEIALAEKTGKLEASNAELEQFAYVASHDLREPLRMVSSFVTLLARRYGPQLNDEAREFIDLAQDGAVRMDRLILDLLEYSRVGRLDRPLVPVPLGTVVEQALRSLALAVDDAKATVEVAADLPLVVGNEEELLRLMLNLTGNALKYRHPERPPQVRIGWRREGAEIVCWVADNGIGIAPQYFDRIFRIFQRLHSRERYEGTGIGLAICKKIVERHQGRIWVESVPDQGSTFYFTLKAA